MKALLLALTWLLAATAIAHDENCKAHCHRKVDGAYEDWPEIQDKATCKARGGRWKHHHAHCHTAGNNPVNDPYAADRFDCAARGGVWSDNTHERLQ